GGRSGRLNYQKGIVPGRPRWPPDPASPWCGSALCDRVLCENLLGALEGFFRRRLRRHPTAHDVVPGGRPDMLILELCIGRIERPEGRQGGAEQALLDVGRPVRILAPLRVISLDRRHARNIAAEPGIVP